MLDHFKTYFPSSNLKSAAVAKKTHSQLRDNMVIHERSKLTFRVSETITNRVLEPNHQPVIINIWEFLFIWLGRKYNQFWTKHCL